MSLSLVTAPTQEPLSYDEAKAQLRVDADDEADFIDDLIPEVRDRAEIATRRAMCTQTWDWISDRFPCDRFMEIPKPPLRTIVWIRYVDLAGVTQTWSPSLYLVQAPVGPRCARGRVALPFGAIWPQTLAQMGAVTVRFTAGYGTPADVPALLKRAMRLDLGTFYENREGVVLGGRGSAPDELPMGVRAIYWSFRSRGTQVIAA